MKRWEAVLKIGAVVFTVGTLASFAFESLVCLMVSAGGGGTMMICGMIDALSEMD